MIENNQKAQKQRSKQNVRYFCLQISLNDFIVIRINELDAMALAFLKNNHTIFFPQEVIDYIRRLQNSIDYNFNFLAKCLKQESKQGKQCSGLSLFTQRLSLYCKQTSDKIIQILQKFFRNSSQKVSPVLSTKQDHQQQTLCSLCVQNLSHMRIFEMKKYLISANFQNRFHMFEPEEACKLSEIILDEIKQQQNWKHQPQILINEVDSRFNKDIDKKRVKQTKTYNIIKEILDKMNKQNESINNMYKLSPDTLDHRMSIEQIDSNKIEKLLREMLEKVGRRLNNNKTDTLEPPIKLTNNEECQTEITCKSLLDETKKLKNTLHHAIVEKDKIIIENKYLIKEIAAKKAQISDQTKIISHHQRKLSTLQQQNLLLSLQFSLNEQPKNSVKNTNRPKKENILHQSVNTQDLEAKNLSIMLDKDKEKDKKYQEQDEDNEAEKEMLRVKKCIQKDTISENDENGTNQAKKQFIKQQTHIQLQKKSTTTKNHLKHRQKSFHHYGVQTNDLIELEQQQAIQKSLNCFQPEAKNNLLSSLQLQPNYQNKNLIADGLQLNDTSTLTSLRVKRRSLKQLTLKSLKKIKRSNKVNDLSADHLQIRQSFCRNLQPRRSEDSGNKKRIQDGRNKLLQQLFRIEIRNYTNIGGSFEEFVKFYEKMMSKLLIDQILNKSDVLQHDLIEKTTSIQRFSSKPIKQIDSKDKIKPFKKVQKTINQLSASDRKDSLQEKNDNLVSSCNFGTKNSHNFIRQELSVDPATSISKRYLLDQNESKEIIMNLFMKTKNIEHYQNTFASKSIINKPSYNQLLKSFDRQSSYAHNKQIECNTLNPSQVKLLNKILIHFAQLKLSHNSCYEQLKQILMNPITVFSCQETHLCLVAKDYSKNLLKNSLQHLLIIHRKCQYRKEQNQDEKICKHITMFLNRLTELIKVTKISKQCMAP